MPISDHLILFARYPEPGTAKTRLIPALGAEGAAALYREMTEHTLNQVQQWVDLPSEGQMKSANSQVEVRFTGGTQAMMQDWLGPNWTYVAQGTGDLGDRLMRSLQAACEIGATRIVIIGTDCPELDADLLHQAFALLTQHDLVLGPALDGGYYLIGVRQFWPELFQHIAWSTAAVLQQTLAIGQQLGLQIALLPQRSDVDYPDDLAIWQRVKESTLGQGVPESA
jgi:rSAM/selenodomain-associated transferase 1